MAHDVYLFSVMSTFNFSRISSFVFSLFRLHTATVVATAAAAVPHTSIIVITLAHTDKENLHTFGAVNHSHAAAKVYFRSEFYFDKIFRISRLQTPLSSRSCD